MTAEKVRSITLRHGDARGDCGTAEASCIDKFCLDEGSVNASIAWKFQGLDLATGAPSNRIKYSSIAVISWSHPLRYERHILLHRSLIFSLPTKSVSTSNAGNLIGFTWVHDFSGEHAAEIVAC